jgi:hypothetical protein
MVKQIQEQQQLLAQQILVAVVALVGVALEQQAAQV